MAGYRIKITDGVGVYHCMTRIVGGDKVLGEDEKRVLLRQVDYLAEFCGVQVLTHAFMDNHFHLLLEISSPPEIDDNELLRRIGVLYGSDRYLAVKSILESADVERAKRLRERFLARMGDLSQFMKELKQRFSIWFNRSNERFGTLYAERFKSVLIEGKKAALLAVAAYIDLNAVRAGKVEDPGDYPFCGYGQAIRGNESAQSGLRRICNEYPWEETLSIYRVILFGKGAKGKFVGQGFTIPWELVQEVLARHGKLDPPHFKKPSVFEEGEIVGSSDFVAAIKKKLVENSDYPKNRKSCPVAQNHQENLFAGKKPQQHRRPRKDTD